MTTTPVSHVDFSTLTSELRILPIAPSWAEVERAIQRLEELHPEAWSEDQANTEVQSDIQTVQNFFQNLEDNREILALALYCAAILGTAGSGTEGERLAAGLRAISRSYGLERLSREERLRELQALAQEIQSRLDIAAVEPPSAVILDQWQAWWKRVVAQTQSLNKEEQWSEATEVAWALWVSRMKDFIEKGITVFQPRLEDLASAVGQSGPHQLFRFDLNQMTLADWSDAFLQSALDAVPDEFIMPTLLQLSGPRTKNLKLLKMNKYTCQLEVMIYVLRNSKCSLSLLVRNAHSTLADTSYPATVAGLIALDLQKLKSLGGYLYELPFSLIFIELPVEEFGAAEWKVTAKDPVEATASLASVLTEYTRGSINVPHLYVAPRNAKVEVPDDAPAIYDPKDADDLLLQGYKLIGTDLTKKPPAKSAEDEEDDEE